MNNFKLEASSILQKRKGLLGEYADKENAYVMQLVDIIEAVTKQNKEYYEIIDSLKQANQALIKKLQLNTECFEAIADSSLSSETDYILEQNRLFKQIASDAIEGLR